MEVLREKKRQLKTSDTKPKLVGHVELDEKGELLKVEAEPEEPDEAWKVVVHQSDGSHSLLYRYETQNGKRTLRSRNGCGLL